MHRTCQGLPAAVAGTWRERRLYSTCTSGANASAMALPPFLPECCHRSCHGAGSVVAKALHARWQCHLRPDVLAPLGQPREPLCNTAWRYAWETSARPLQQCIATSRRERKVARLRHRPIPSDACFFQTRLSMLLLLWAIALRGSSIAGDSQLRASRVHAAPFSAR